MKHNVGIVPVFDIGNVLLEWNPRNLYRKIFTDHAAMEVFLAEVCTQAWNEEHDRGRSFADGVALLVQQFPQHEHLIRAYDERWHEMIPSEIARSVEVLQALRREGIPNYAITNFSAEKFASTRVRFPFLAGFDGVVVSADEKLLKPDAAIYRVLLDRFGLSAADCLFIDDSLANVEGARAVGMQAVHFTGPDVLVEAFEAAGLPVA